MPKEISRDPVLAIQLPEELMYAVDRWATIRPSLWAGVRPAPALWIFLRARTFLSCAATAG